MIRPYTQSETSVPPPASTPLPLHPERPAHTASGLGSWWDQLLLRFVFSVACVVSGYHFHPFGLSSWVGAGVGFGFSISVFLFEARLKYASMRRLVGAVIGSILGILGAYFMGLVLVRTTIPESSRSFLDVSLLLVMTYIGLALGANKGPALEGLFGSERGARRIPKVLDTSVIIDGRIADICEAHFLDGVLLIPQFVLHELQQVADSADSTKRQRGRRGLEVLQRIRKMPHLEIDIVDDDFTNIADVDMKLIELAKRYVGKIVTNDYNLNKVATLQGIEILNVNQLANALKPVVLPGEIMRVFILREGKEHNQGVAYLDDGTMVVVDGARRMINKTVDITVTSVHQTTAGKMIFGRYDERTESQTSRLAPPHSPTDATPPRPVERSSSHSEANAGGERVPRPVVPDTSHGPE
ncbi:MAG: TRAM domain-containing protein [Acidobacteriia bacterium]|nr:TRAM domain-containing protein [Terriglobia bacterium]